MTKARTGGAKKRARKAGRPRAQAITMPGGVIYETHPQQPGESVGEQRLRAMFGVVRGMDRVSATRFNRMERVASHERMAYALGRARIMGERIEAGEPDLFPQRVLGGPISAAQFEAGDIYAKMDAKWRGAFGLPALSARSAQLRAPAGDGRDSPDEARRLRAQLDSAEAAILAADRDALMHVKALCLLDHARGVSWPHVRVGLSALVEEFRVQVEEAA